MSGFSTSAPVLDREHLALYSGGDPALEAELFALLGAQIADCTARMRAANSAEDWRAAAHTLKGAARGVGAKALGEACAAAEDRPLDGAALDAVEAQAVRARSAMTG